MTPALQSRGWLIVPMVAAVHLTFALGVVLDPEIAHITALHYADVFFGDALPLVLVLVAVIALGPMAVLMSAQAIHLCLWPQQLMLFLWALSAVDAALAGHYPDGTPKQGLFILVDQCFSVWTMLAHFAALIANARRQ